MDRRAYTIRLMAEIILTDDAFNGDGLNQAPIWDRFMKTLMDYMHTDPDGELRPAMAQIDRDQFQEWIDDPVFWEEINAEIERRTQVLMTIMPGQNQGHC